MGSGVGKELIKRLDFNMSSKSMSYALPNLDGEAMTMVSRPLLISFDSP